LTLRIHQLVGAVVGYLGPSTDFQVSTIVTPAETIHHRRARVLASADELGNVSEVCSQMGILPDHSYHYSRAALMPKDRRAPHFRTLSRSATAARHPGI
jgi:hypothetical protein